MGLIGIGMGSGVKGNDELVLTITKVAGLLAASAGIGSVFRYRFLAKGIATIINY